MNKKKNMAVVLLVLLLSVGGHWGYKHFPHRETGAITATGTGEATTVDLSARIAGAIKSISVDAGDSVSRGQLVAELSRNDLVAQRERDALAVLKAEAALADLLSGAREQEIKQASLALDAARVDFEQAYADFKRVETLYQAEAVPLVDYENAANRLKLAENQVEAARARLSLLESGSRPQQIQAARAEVERSKAVLKATEAMLEDLKIVSPIDGEVLAKNYEVGEYVVPGTPVITIADLSNMWIKVYIPTDDLPSIKLGQKVTFTVSGISQVFTGVVSEIATKGEFTPKTIQTEKERANIVFGVKIKVDDGRGILKPGMPADVVFE